MTEDRGQATRAARLDAIDAQDDVRKIPPGAVSPTHVTEDDIYIQFNARFRPVAAPPGEEEEEEAVAEQPAAEQPVEVSEE